MENEVYSIQRTTQTLEHGTYKGFNYYIISYGSHPCCYIEIPKNHKYYHVGYDDLYHIQCHGGLTYAEEHLLNIKNSWFLGWDYAHYGDYSMIDKILYGKDRICGNKYTLKQLRAEVYEVINQLI